MSEGNPIGPTLEQTEAISKLPIVGGRPFILLADSEVEGVKNVITTMTRVEMLATALDFARQMLPLRLPKDDPDTRPLLDRVKDPRQLGRDLVAWVLPLCDLVVDENLRARCSLLLGVAAGALDAEGKRRELTGEVEG